MGRFMSVTNTISRIGLWVLLIFGLGFWVGRMSTVRWKMEVVGANDTPDSSTTLDESDLVEDVTRREMIRATRRVMENYRSTLGLSSEQVGTVKPIFIRAGQEMAKLPKQSPLRMGVLQRFHEQLQPHLTEEQKKLSEDILKKYSKPS